MKQVKNMLVTMTTFFEEITKENEEYLGVIKDLEEQVNDLRGNCFDEKLQENKKLKEENKELKEENETLEKEVEELRDGEDSFRDGIIDGLQAEIKQLKDIENHPDYVLHFSELVADLRAENTKLKEALNKVKRDLSPQR